MELSVQEAEGVEMEGSCSVEVFSRVTGFFRPVQGWNKGKAEEFGERKNFKCEKSEKAEVK
ncbi:MAG: hypothetical protein GF408_02595 [Candidatus Omnitrophica bacterium]|nr:hypothetical protein [Candidatus Omnitrophota bacterium]